MNLRRYGIIGTILLFTLTAESANLIMSSIKIPSLGEVDGAVESTIIWSEETGDTIEIKTEGIGTRTAMGNDPWLGNLSETDKQKLYATGIEDPEFLEADYEYLIYYKWELYEDSNKKFPTYIPISDKYVGIVIRVSSGYAEDDLKSGSGDYTCLAIIITDVTQGTAVKAIIIRVDSYSQGPKFPALLSKQITPSDSQINFWMHQ